MSPRLLYSNIPPPPTTGPSGNDAYMAFSDVNPVRDLSIPLSLRPAYRLVAGMVGRGGLNKRRTGAVIRQSVIAGTSTRFCPGLFDTRFPLLPKLYRKAAAGLARVHRNRQLPWATGDRTSDLAAPCVINNSNQNSEVSNV